jgi:dipeptidyl aminopeptidase/acylaminoacyl peptidase
MSAAPTQLSYRTGSGAVMGMTVRRPPAARGLVVFVHGGGFVGGSRADMDRWAGLLTADGYASATIDYRLGGAGGRERALGRAVQDTTAALARLRTQSTLSRLRVVLWGYSAGALTVLRAAGELPGRVAAVVSLAGYERPAQIRRGHPPMLLFNGTADRVEPVALAAATCRAARAVSVDCELVTYRGATHSLGPAQTSDVHRRALTWLRRFDPRGARGQG